MKTLTINSVEKRVQFLLTNENTVLCFEDWLPRYGGTELLILAIEAACQKTGIEVREIKKIACVVGPGNFMGIRLAMSTSASLSRAVGAEQAGLNYLQCLAAAVPAKENDHIVILTSATREYAHRGDFIMGSNGIPIQQGTLTLFPLNSTETETAQWLAGSACRTESMQKVFPHAHILPVTYDSPTAQALHTITQSAQWQEKDPDPIYLKECDALQNFAEIARKQGHDPLKARQELEKLLSSTL